MLIKILPFFFIFNSVVSSPSKDALRDRLLERACDRNSAFVFCGPSSTIATPVIHRDDDIKSRKDDGSVFEQIEQTSKKVGNLDEDTENNLVLPPPTPEKLKDICYKYYPLITKTCGRQHLRKESVAKCMAYFRDCKKFIPQEDPLGAIANSFSSGVGLNYGSFDVKGIPFYPVNEEGAIGAGTHANVGFGSWGGGYSQNVGVRDYWSQTFDVGANWYEGRYGYRTGWSVPLVQSLGIEGGGGTDVNVPLKPGSSTIDVDNHYGVGGYYKHNYHTGVDWKKGNVENIFGVGVPFAGVGFQTGTAVAFPSIDAFTRAGK
uniref:Secreted protein n=1 Tax=Rhabditophanes sp. KR3021 TaxID=114890 RepID=A0AC35TRJ5_9BILA